MGQLRFRQTSNDWSHLRDIDGLSSSVGSPGEQATHGSGHTRLGHPRCRGMLWAALAVMVAASAASAEIRIWQKQERNDSFRAELVGFNASQLRLRRASDDETITFDAGKPNVSALLYTSEPMQAPGPVKKPDASKSQAEMDARETPTVATGKIAVHIEASPYLKDTISEKIQEALSQQLASLGPVPAETETSIRLTLRIRAEQIVAFRLGRHAISVADPVASWVIAIQRTGLGGRRSSALLHSSKLEISGIELLDKPPEKIQPAIKRMELEDMLIEAATDAILQWRIPKNIFAGTSE